MLKLNYHHFAVGNVPLFNHPPFGRPALHTRIDGTCKFDPLSSPKKFDLSPKTPSAAGRKNLDAHVLSHPSRWLASHYGECSGRVLSVDANGPGINNVIERLVDGKANEPAHSLTSKTLSPMALVEGYISIWPLIHPHRETLVVTQRAHGSALCLLRPI